VEDSFLTTTLNCYTVEKVIIERCSLRQTWIIWNISIRDTIKSDALLTSVEAKQLFTQTFLWCGLDWQGKSQISFHLIFSKKLHNLHANRNVKQQQQQTFLIMRMLCCEIRNIGQLPRERWNVSNERRKKKTWTCLNFFLEKELLKVDVNPSISIPFADPFAVELPW
jgi:hypothetical protein